MIDLRDACVLITGGSEGIGRGLAERFLKAGGAVLVTGRSQERLEGAASKLKGLHTFRNDISRPDERLRLAEYVKSQYPNLNVVINKQAFNVASLSPPTTPLGPNGRPKLILCSQRRFISIIF